MKNRKKQTALLTLGLFIILISCSKSDLNQKDEIEALLKADKDWAEAVATKDLKRTMTYYDTASFLMAGTQIVKGLSNLETRWIELMESPGFQLKWEAQGAEVSGNLGFTYGYWEQNDIKESDTIISKGTYLAAWKKQNNGEWKALIDKPL